MFFPFCFFVGMRDISDKRSINYYFLAVEDVEGKNVDKPLRGLEGQAFFVNRDVWKTGKVVHGFPQDKMRPDLSTARVNNFLWKRWKT